MAGVELDGKPEIYQATNIGADGRVLPKDHPLMQFNKGNMQWHSDSSFKKVPAMASLLRAIEVPDAGADTEFANLSAAYAALSEEMKQRIAGLVAVHDFNWSRRDIENVVMSGDEMDLIPPVQHKLVRTHPETGRKSLYLGSHAARIVDMDEAEGRRLLDELTEFATEPRFTYSHQWRPGDLVWWDNRCAVHRATRYDINSYRRRLHRTTIAGTGPVT
jgi:alpha-ketoglutarate-dependent taurine dioxygenase